MNSGSRLIDTSALIDIIHDTTSDAALTAYLRDGLISLICWGEMLIGSELGEQGKLERRRIQIAGQTLGMLPVTMQTCKSYAVVFAQLRRAGKQIPTNDIWIAACALEHDLPLDTTDAHFALVPGLRLV